MEGGLKIPNLACIQPSPCTEEQRGIAASLVTSAEAAALSCPPAPCLLLSRTGVLWPDSDSLYDFGKEPREELMRPSSLLLYHLI